MKRFRKMGLNCPVRRACRVKRFQQMRRTHGNWYFESKLKPCWKKTVFHRKNAERTNVWKHFFSWCCQGRKSLAFRKMCTRMSRAYVAPGKRAWKKTFGVSSGKYGRKTTWRRFAGCTHIVDSAFGKGRQMRNSLLVWPKSGCEKFTAAGMDPRQVAK